MMYSSGCGHYMKINKHNRPFTRMTHLKPTPMTQRLSIAILAKVKKSEMRHVVPGL